MAKMSNADFTRVNLSKLKSFQDEGKEVKALVHEQLNHQEKNKAAKMYTHSLQQQQIFSTGVV